MISKQLATVICLALILGLPVGGLAQSGPNPNHLDVTILLKDDTEVNGRLLQMTQEFVLIDPEGPVSLRKIFADMIYKVRVHQLATTYEYPLTRKDLPKPLQENIVAEIAAAKRNLQKPVLGLLTVGLSTNLGGQYYEGFGSGLSYRAGLLFRLGDLSPNTSTLFLGLHYRRSILGVERGGEYIGYDDLGNTVTFSFEDAKIQHIVLEFGRASAESKSGSWAHISMGLSFLTSTLKATITDTGSEAEDSYSETKVALRMGVGGVIGVSPKSGIAINLITDLLLQSRETTYGWSQTDVGGSILVFETGFVREF